MSSLNIFILSPFIASADSHALPQCDSFHPEQMSKTDEIKSPHRLYREPRRTVIYCCNECLTLMQLQMKLISLRCLSSL